MTQDEWDALVSLTATFEGLAETLLREHQPDRHDRCTGCHLPQSGDMVWPCTLHNLGVAAIKARPAVVVLPLRSPAG